MSFDFCPKHAKRYEKGRSVCLGCHEDGLRSQLSEIEEGLRNQVKALEKALIVARAGNVTQPKRDRAAYMREYRARQEAIYQAHKAAQA